MQLSLVNDRKDVYVADTSALIDLDRLYPKNIPAFKAIWDEIESLISKEQFRTLDFVDEELDRFLGERTSLQEWVQAHKKKLVFPSDADCINAAIPIINEEYETGFFTKKKLAEGRDEADPYLIAYCKLHSYKLISTEKNSTNKIPGVAKKNGVECINLIDFFKERNIRS